MESFVWAFVVSLVAVAAIRAWDLEPVVAACCSKSATMLSISTRLYQTSRLVIAAICRMASRYTRPRPTTASVRTLLGKPS